MGVALFDVEERGGCGAVARLVPLHARAGDRRRVQHRRHRAEDGAHVHHRRARAEPARRHGRVRFPDVVPRRARGAAAEPGAHVLLRVQLSVRARCRRPPRQDRARRSLARRLRSSARVFTPSATKAGCNYSKNVASYIVFLAETTGLATARACAAARKLLERYTTLDEMLDDIRGNGCHADEPMCGGGPRSRRARPSCPSATCPRGRGLRRPMRHGSSSSLATSRWSHYPLAIEEKGTYYARPYRRSEPPGRHSDLDAPRYMRRWTRAYSVFPSLPEWAAREIPKARNAWASDIALQRRVPSLLLGFLVTLSRRRHGLATEADPSIDPAPRRPSWRVGGLDG